MSETAKVVHLPKLPEPKFFICKGCGMRGKLFVDKRECVLCGGKLEIVDEETARKGR